MIYTQDPGRALISGKCDDVGAIVMQQFRGLAARAPYFSNGSAASLRELVDFYDRRFNIGYTEQEKTDLVNFLGVAVMRTAPRTRLATVLLLLPALLNAAPPAGQPHELRQPARSSATRARCRAGSANTRAIATS